MKRAMSALKAMSVAHGMAQPLSSSGGPHLDASSRNVAAGPTIPPAAASSGNPAVFIDDSGPPGSVASKTSLAAMAKKNTMPMSLTQKWRACSNGA